MLTSSELRRQALERIQRGELRPPKKDTEPGIPRASSEEIPLSCGQQQIWLHSEFASGAPIYSESVTVRKSGPLDPVVLESCFNEIVRRHAILRTAFLDSSGQVRQAVIPQLRVPLPLIDLSHLSRHEGLAAAMRLARQDASRPFDLSRAPLLRGRLVRLAADDHRLYLTLHHLIFDGVSINSVLLPELVALYRAFSAGYTCPLPELPIQYGDYALWQQRKVAQGDYAGQLSYWRRNLENEAPPLELPIALPRVGPPTWQGGMEGFTMPGGLARTVRQFSASEGATPYMTLLAAFHALLYRYSGQPHITTGGIVSTRNRTEMEPLIGFLLNTVVLRSQVDASLPFRGLLNQIKDTVLGALANRDVPFDAVVRELAPKRDPCGNTLFQILFSMRPASADLPDGWTLNEIDVHSGAAAFDLFVDVIEHTDTLLGRFIYSSDLFDRAAITRMIGYWQTLLEAGVQNPDLPIGLLPMLPSHERQTILSAGAGPSVEVPPTTISAWIEETVARVPAHTGVIFEGQQLSFRELDARAAAFAGELRAAGAKRGVLVAISIERSIEMLVALLGILKTGAAYLPIDPTFPAERRAFLLSEAEPHLLVRSRALTITPCHAPGSVSYAGLAYVLHTSGSTGVPKGVEVLESAVVNLLRSMRKEPGFSSSDVLLAVTTLSFDIAVLELLLPLVSGGTVVIASRETVSDPARLIEAIRDSECTVMQGTPALWRSLVDAGWTGDSRLKILCGGEALRRNLADQLLPRCHELWNLYGPTETTIWSTVQKVKPGGNAIPIGRPIDNTQVYVLDRQLQILPPGITGELYIGGRGVARGYAGRPDLTAERFLPSPFVTGERLYRTGDLARWRSGGDLELLGRADQQVKVRGHRIELQEVEDVLAKAPGVRGSAVKAWRDASGENALVAYIEGSPGAPLREYLVQKLPDYMIPSRFIEMPALPLTPNGKLDRNTLPDPSGVPLAAPRPTAPRSETERRVAALWAGLLKTHVPDIHEDFFSLGGHSLLAAELSQRIHLEFGKRLSLPEIFGAPTIARLSELLDAEQHGAGQRCLYWIYGGTVFQPLAAHLRATCRWQDVWLPQELEETVSLSDRLEDVARHLVDGMRSHPANGAYHLGGWCIAGILAYEVAVQLEALGEEVALVALLGAPNPRHYAAIPRHERVKSKLQYHWNQMTCLDAAGASRYLVERARHQVQKHKPVQFRDFNRILEELALRYEPKPLHARVALFQGQDRPSMFDYAPGWREVVKGEFLAYDVPGNHSTSLEEPHVAVLAGKLRDCLGQGPELRRPFTQ